VRPSQIPGAGMGLFAQKDFQKGEYVTNYGGVIVDQEKVKEEPFNSSMYKLLHPSGHTLDARFVFDMCSDRGRWINDSRGSDFQNNCEYVAVNSTDAHILTTSPVKEGEESFVEYGESYWTNLE
jgi:SET domain-containing protein